LDIVDDEKLLSVLIPAYNEAKKISLTVNELIATLNKAHLKYEVVIVDDGSNDETLAEAKKIADCYPEVKICHYSPNMGKGYAVAQGFKYTSGNRVIFLDADLELPPSQIPDFLNSVNGNHFDILIGSKKHPRSSVKINPTRRYLSECYNMLVELLFHIDVSDVGVGLKLFNREVLEAVLPKLNVRRYAFDVELLAWARHLGYTVEEAPVTLQGHFNSRIVYRGVWRIFWDTMSVYVRMKVLHRISKRN
jgi:glycosyltransferase involved in cell wall biosynthesis